MAKSKSKGNGKPTKCTICGVSLKSGKALGGHMSKHTKQKKTESVGARLQTPFGRAVKRTKPKKKMIISGGMRLETPFGMADIVPTIKTPNSFSGPSIIQSLLPAAQEAKKLKDAYTSIVTGLRDAAAKKRNEARDLDVLANTTERLL